MSAVLLRGAAEQGLIYSLVALALYLSYRTLNIADLTVDGSFTLGAAAGAMLTSRNGHRPASNRAEGTADPRRHHYDDRPLFH